MSTDDPFVNQADALAGLKAAWPGWRIWYVPHFQPPSTVWCALADADNPWCDDGSLLTDRLPVHTLNADSPEELAAAMAGRAAELATP